MNYKNQLKLATSGIVPFFMVYLGYKYTIFHGMTSLFRFNLKL